MKDLFEIMESRRSIRKFKPRSPDAETIRRLVHYATTAPNAMNRQDWHFTVVTSKAARENIHTAVMEKWDHLLDADSGAHEAVRSYAGHFGSFLAAPVVIIVQARRPPAFLEHIAGHSAESVMGSRASACMAAQNLMLAAHAMGLGTCAYTGCNAAEQEIRQIAGLSARQEVVCLVALGYPDEDPPDPGRKPVEEVVSIFKE